MTVAAARTVPSRPPELQDWLNARLYHPLSRRLAAVLAPTFVTPNMVSVAGGLAIVAAGLAYVGLSSPLSVAAGLALHLSWHVIDGADGDLARMTGRSSPLGELIDGICDYAGHIILYLTLTIAAWPATGWWIWPLAAAAGAAHVIQANHAESQKRTYLWWAYGVPWLRQTRGREAFGGVAVRGYVALAAAMNRSADAVEAELARGARDPALLAAMRNDVRRCGRRLLAFAKLTGPNPRAFLLAAAMMAGSVAWFFLAEIVLLNLVLVAAILDQRSENRKLAAQLRALS